MPTKNPRALINLQPDYYRALKSLAACRGVSVSRLVNQILEPTLTPLVKAGASSVPRPLPGLPTPLPAFPEGRGTRRKRKGEAG